jgi:acetyl esterase/lipase
MEHVKRRFKSQKTFSIIKSFYKIANVQLKEINGHKCYVIIPKNASTKKCMYIHGGGFVTQITPFHWFFIKRLLLATKATFYVPDYPLSTDTYASAKDAVTMLLETYKLMLIDTKPENITVMGDSAGGTLTLVLAQQAKLNGLPAPKNLIPLSPALDLEIDIAKSYEYASRDSVLTQGLLYCASK